LNLVQETGKLWREGHPRQRAPALRFSYQGANMKIASLTLSAMVLALSTASITMAQSTTAQIMTEQIMTAQSGIGAVAGGFATGGDVANLPYSATVKTTTVQRLADGTTITRVSTTKEARDSAGRSMHQSSNERPDGEPAIVNTSVMDPTNRTMTHWFNLSKQATVVHLPELKAVTPTSLSSRTADGAGGSIGSGAGQPLSVSTPPAQTKVRKRQREQLGGKTIAGVYAEGNRTTTTIPEGAEGNDRPMTIVSETWRSPELKITLLSVNDDPRSGKRTTEVTDLDRAEPDPSVFQVPEGYTVKDQSPSQSQ
jgi:hypothetical protein